MKPGLVVLICLRANLLGDLYELPIDDEISVVVQVRTSLDLSLDTLHLHGTEPTRIFPLSFFLPTSCFLNLAPTEYAFRRLFNTLFSSAVIYMVQPLLPAGELHFQPPKPRR